jgi:diaminopimelate epimerase
VGYYLFAPLRGLRMTSIPFTKAQAVGNDFLIIEGTPDALISFPEAIRRLCDRRFGVGADGIAFLTVPSRDDADADLRLFNADGGEAEISGNGTRCAAAVLAGRNQSSDRKGGDPTKGSVAGAPGPEHLRIRTQAGVKTLRLVSRSGNRWEFEMAMGAPILAAREIPFAPPSPVPEPIVGFPLPVKNGPKQATITSMGNPHCSIAVESFDWDWRACGKEIETHSFFPSRTNVEFYRALSPRLVEVRYWERGVGETLSSGTGSCAAAVAAILNHHAQSPVTVRTAAGDLAVRWEPDGVYLTGPAEITFTGEAFVVPGN